jgi:hypothetical protein
VTAGTNEKPLRRAREAIETGRLLTADELSAWLHVSKAYVYEHAVELGALRLGAGPKARLRFEPEEVRRRISCVSGRESNAADPAPVSASPPRRRRRLGTKVELLPIRERGTARQPP